MLAGLLRSRDVPAGVGLIPGKPDAPGPCDLGPQPTRNPLRPPGQPVVGFHVGPRCSRFVRTGTRPAEYPVRRDDVVRRLIITIACVLGLGLDASSAPARCLSYEPARVTLEGTIRSRTLPGPPNYVSIARGDHPEVIFVLVLDAPICVSGNPSSRTNSKSHARVTEVQLVDSEANPRRFLEKRVRVSGSFFGAQSRHHRTPIVLNITGIRAVTQSATEGE